MGTAGPVDCVVSSNPSINARNPPAAETSPAVLASFPLQSPFNSWPIRTPLHPYEDVVERGRSRSPKSRQSRPSRRCRNITALFPRTFRTQCSASNAVLEATALDSGGNGAILWLWIDVAVRKVGGMSSNAVQVSVLRIASRHCTGPSIESTLFHAFWKPPGLVLN